MKLEFRVLWVLASVTKWSCGENCLSSIQSGVNECNEGCNYSGKVVQWVEAIRSIFKMNKNKHKKNMNISKNESKL